MDFLNKIKQEIRPDTSVLVEIELFVKEINKEIAKNKIKAECTKGGSVAKGTFLRGDFDVDLFVRFDYKYKDEDLSKLLEKILKNFKPTLVHGSRDYFQLKQSNLNYEIVPVLKVKNPEKSLNVTDMSPLHVDWVKKNIKKGQDDDIRLAKKFCKAIGVYGAESYINGFSGHVIDIMIIYYGSFMNLLKNSQKWQPKVIIDTEKYYKNKRDVLFNINTSKLQSPIIVIDPILKTRNAASALSYEKFALFKEKAKQFLKKPEKRFFVELKIGKTYLRQKYKKNLYILTLKAKKGKDDVVGSKILKAFKFMKNELKKKGFDFKDSGWYWNKTPRVLYWFVFKDKLLPKKSIIKGPPLDMKEACVNFKKSYKKTLKKSGKLCAEIVIEKRTPEENIKELSKKDYFKEKIKLIEIES